MPPPGSACPDVLLLQVSPDLDSLARLPHVPHLAGGVRPLQRVARLLEALLTHSGLAGRSESAETVGVAAEVVCRDLPGDLLPAAHRPVRHRGPGEIQLQRRAAKREPTALAADSAGPDGIAGKVNVRVVDEK